jgi:hypothetical protein
MKQQFALRSLFFAMAVVGSFAAAFYYLPAGFACELLTIFVVGLPVVCFPHPLLTAIGWNFAGALIGVHAGMAMCGTGGGGAHLLCGSICWLAATGYGLRNVPGEANTLPLCMLAAVLVACIVPASDGWYAIEEMTTTMIVLAILGSLFALMFYLLAMNAVRPKN